MSRHTVLAYISEEDRAEQILSAAATLSRRDHSHLIGVYVIPPITVYPIVGDLPLVVHEGHFRLHQELAKKLEEDFDEAIKGDGFVAEWRTIDSGASPISEALMDHVRCADIAIAPHYSADDSDKPCAGIGEALAMGSGRPVLLIPKHARTDVIGKNIAVAWDGSRESVRAVFDAIDLLQEADSVRILSVTNPSNTRSNVSLPGAEIAATLTRRGVKCQVDHVDPGELSVGDAILGRIGDMGSDLLVMGIYGHSKLREFVFGGVTRHIMNHMTVPTLFSR